ncbi:sn-glycerol-3-phosphate ABC transporter ATP-binding protein UgpC [Cognatishimia sp. SS12]|uniref:ABC transporter ATP-binding protein n=1 Tax=Cognatishimia sp. SS12 TaxID=2979465 RepID=UPI00232E9FDF|nr:sn-glycerol-3-phosphate ABC transporter ATP-binding protein UgpC [Cognatishimia sp. SS12]MDC0738305.1 sn-glycerol-3-phosphate ABC transporter ATP-binding protein UgpC [Cognatishimia sp. SS12]
MANVQTRNIKKKYGSVEVLHGIDLEIEDKEFVALVGPSGCGKSTLLRIIAGLEEHSGGDVLIGGETVSDLTPKDRDIAMVFQSYALYPHKNVYENLAFTLRMRNTPKGEIDTKVRAAAEALNLTDYLDRAPAQLSGGQRQRVAMGRALVRKPKVFLFDEPLSNLDAKLRVEMRTEIRRLHQDLNATSIYVTHDQVEAMTMADRIVVLHDGDIIQVGKPMELYDAPATTFVASFIGSPQMNLFEGNLDAAGGHFHVSTGSSIRLGKQYRSEASVTLGIRPDDLELDASDAADIQGKIRVVEHTGGETLVFVDTPFGPLCVRAPARSQARVGDITGVKIDRERLHMFDASGLRMSAGGA